MDEQEPASSGSEYQSEDLPDESEGSAIDNDTSAAEDADKNDQTKEALSPQQDTGSTHTRIVRQRISKVNAEAFTQYQKLLNTVIEEARSSSKTQGDEQPLPASYVGSSFWTPQEKELFFDALAKYGPDNLPRLCQKIGTKTESEIRLYILILQDGLQQATTKQIIETSSLSKSAFDIDDDCETSMDSLALRIEDLVHEQVCEAEKAKYGDDWIVDEARAEHYEELAQPIVEMLEQEAEQIISNTRSQHTESSQAVSGRSSSLDHQAGLPSGEYVKSAVLLRPVAFVTLMRNVFMNANDGKTLNLGTLPIVTPDSSGPALHRSAFELFHDLTVSFTRRLVHAALFQTMTRVRAAHDDRTLFALRSIDVTTALDVLGIRRPRRARYWSKAVRRYSLDLYSHRKEPRPHEGNWCRSLGFKLTESEVADALAYEEQSDDDRKAWQIADDNVLEGSSLPARHDDKAVDENRSAQNTDEEDTELRRSTRSLKDQRANTDENTRLRTLLHLSGERALASPSPSSDESDDESGLTTWRETTSFVPHWQSTHHNQGEITERPKKRQKLNDGL